MVCGRGFVCPCQISLKSLEGFALQRANLYRPIKKFQILTVWGATVPRSSTDKVEIWQGKANPMKCLSHQISLLSVQECAWVYSPKPPNQLHDYDGISYIDCLWLAIHDKWLPNGCVFDQRAPVFIARQHTDARYWYSKSAVRLSVRNVPVLDEIGLTYRHSFFHHTVAQSF